MKVYEAIRKKRAVRKFTDQAISEEHVLKILNAGRRAQSSKNTQPWQFIAVRDKAILKRLSKTGFFAGHMAGADLAVVILTPNPEKKASIMFDAGQAAAYMQLAAWEMGIASCLATIYKHKNVKNILNFPDDWYSNMAISFGYPQKVDLIHADPRKRGRKKLEKFIHFDQWQE